MKNHIKRTIYACMPDKYRKVEKYIPLLQKKRAQFHFANAFLPSSCICTMLTYVFNMDAQRIELHRWQRPSRAPPSNQLWACVRCTPLSWSSSMSFSRRCRCRCMHAVRCISKWRVHTACAACKARCIRAAFARRSEEGRTLRHHVCRFVYGHKECEEVCMARGGRAQ